MHVQSRKEKPALATAQTYFLSDVDNERWGMDNLIWAGYLISSMKKKGRKGGNSVRSILSKALVSKHVHTASSFYKFMWAE